MVDSPTSRSEAHRLSGRHRCGVCVAIASMTVGWGSTICLPLSTRLKRSPLGVSQNRLAVAISVPPRRINEIVHGKRRITADTAHAWPATSAPPTGSGSTSRPDTTSKPRRTTSDTPGRHPPSRRQRGRPTHRSDLPDRMGPVRHQIGRRPPINSVEPSGPRAGRVRQTRARAARSAQDARPLERPERPFNAVNRLDAAAIVQQRSAAATVVPRRT